MENFTKYCKFLGLKKPVEITLTDKVTKKWDAFYLPRYNKKGKLKNHCITISIAGNRDINTLVMHELIHAWQEEKRKTEIHGKHFRKWAKKAYLHFGLSQVFIKGVDKK